MDPRQPEEGTGRESAAGPAGAPTGARGATRATKPPGRLRRWLRSDPPPPITDLPPVRRWFVVAVALLLFLIYAATLARGVSIGDGGEITTAIVELGVIHPTGYPLFTMVAHLFTRIPIPVEPVVKVEIFNAVCGVGASTFLTLVTRKLILGVRRRRAAGGEPPPEDSGALWLVDACAAFAGLSFGLGPMYWDQVRIPEVYPLHLFLICWALYHWVNFEFERRNKDAVLACIPMGLACAHHVTIVYMLGASALYLLLRKPSVTVNWLLAIPVLLVRRFRPQFMSRLDVSTWWVVPACLLVGALPVLFYGYFLWADAHTIGLSWGKVDDPKSMWNHMSGRQYRSYMKGWGYKHLWARVNAMPRWFDKQYLAGSLITGGVGIFVLARRHTPYFLFILAFGLANIGHGVQYSARDHQNYYLPAVAVSAILIGVGVWWLCDRLGDERRAGRVGRLGIAASLALALTAGSMAVYRGVMPDRLPEVLHFDMWTFIGIGIAGAVLCLAFAVLAWLGVRKARGDGRQTGGALSLVLLAGVFALHLGPWISRFIDMRQFHRNSAVAYIEAADYAMGPGSVYIMGGDDFAFPMWYSQHALGWNRDLGVVNVHMLSKNWYRRGYLASRHPTQCDPLAAENLADPEGWEARCGEYEQRRELYDRKTWLKLDGPRSRTGRKTKREKPLDLKIINKSHPRCQDAQYAKKNKSKCKCWDFNEFEREWDNDCVHSHEVGGIAYLTRRERWMLEIIASHIDERDVFERNLYTRWRAAGKNGLGWTGPAYHRVSGEYHLVNRGFVNQIVYNDDVEDMDLCAETLESMPLRERMFPAAKRKPPRKMNSYRPNPRPTLVQYSVLQNEDLPQHHFDSREFSIDDPLGLTMFWFERNYYDFKASDKKGKPIRHGVRVCWYDGDGKRVHTGSVVTRDPKNGFVPLPVEARTEPGTYTVQACTVGDVKNLREVPDDLPCKNIVLEYEFELTNAPKD